MSCERIPGLESAKTKPCQLCAIRRAKRYTDPEVLAAIAKADKFCKGTYLGKTVQVVPHVVNAIQDSIERVARIPVDDSGDEPDVCIGMFCTTGYR